MSYCKLNGTSFDVNIAISAYKRKLNILHGESAGRVSAELHRAQEGKNFRVLIDGTAKNGDYTLSARTAGGRLVHLRGDESLIGSWANARIVSSNTFALFGEITE